MQSDPRIVAALSALRPRIDGFRTAVSGALDRARATLSAESPSDQLRATLGQLGGRLIDVDRFAAISSGTGPLDDITRKAVEHAVEILDELANSDDELFVIDVPPGGSLAYSVRARLAELGRVFGAAKLVDQIRRHAYDASQNGLSLDAHPFERWTASERKFAPPLVIVVAGSDFDPFALAPLLDGWVRFVLLVEDPASPAPLARLISPGVFAAQCADLKVIDTLNDFGGPAVIAFMSEKQACFTHDPRGGSAFWQRLQVSRMPEIVPRKSLGVRTAWQQREDLALLKALSERPVVVSSTGEVLVGAGIAGGADPTEKLTAWLLDQSDFGGNGESQ